MGQYLVQLAVDPEVMPDHVRFLMQRHVPALGLSHPNGACYHVEVFHAAVIVAIGVGVLGLDDQLPLR
jgi:hypothetical protein